MIAQCSFPLVVLAVMLIAHIVVVTGLITDTSRTVPHL